LVRISDAPLVNSAAGIVPIAETPAFRRTNPTSADVANPLSMTVTPR